MSVGEQHRKLLYQFGPFRVDPDKELLFRDAELVPLTPKAFQILLVLLRHGRETVTKDDLMKAVWPDSFVEEANLSRNIFLLRKALGEGPQDHRYVLTVPGRGYRLAESVQLVPFPPGRNDSSADTIRDLTIVAATQSRIRLQVAERFRLLRLAIGVVVLVLALAAVAAWFLWPRTSALTEKDSVV